MRRILIVILLLVTTSAYADHIGRLWCGKLSTARQGTYDTSAECNTEVQRELVFYSPAYCVDTTHGPVWKSSGSPMAGHYGSCAAGYASVVTCHCEAETVEHKTK